MNFENAREEGAGNSSFSRAAATFSCANGKIQLRDLSLIGSEHEIGREIAGMGTVDFGRNLNLRLRVSEPASEGTDSEVSTTWFQLSGTLASPQVSRVPVPAKRTR
jgi:hypothetical protein